MNATTITAKNAVAKNTDLMNLSFIRDTTTVFPELFMGDFSVSVMISRPFSCVVKKS